MATQALATAQFNVEHLFTSKGMTAWTGKASSASMPPLAGLALLHDRLVQGMRSLRF